MDNWNAWYRDTLQEIEQGFYYPDKQTTRGKANFDRERLEFRIKVGKFKLAHINRLSGAAKITRANITYLESLRPQYQI